MQIQLYRSFSEIQHVSMKLYADRLSRALKHEYPSEEITEFVQDEHLKRLTGIAALDRRMDRYVRIPRRAARLQGTVNHVVDHAESHLLNHLEPDRTIVTCHDILPTVLWQKGIRTMTRHQYWMSVRKIRNLRKAKFVITDSESTRQDLVSLYGIDESRTVTVHLGVDECFRESDGAACRSWLAEEHGVPVDTPVLLHVGNNHVYKNVDGLLKELGQLKDQHWTFIKVGPKFTPTQLAIIQKNGLQERLIRIDWLSSEGLRMVYNAADLLLFPSLYEGFGWPPLEAMMCGTAVVCSDRGSLKETSGECAWIIDPDRTGELAEVVRQLLQDPSLTHEKVNQGKTHAAQFSWERCARKTYEVYKHALG
jgi:glycosyltransferase involved in cell wall biosynthesis